MSLKEYEVRFPRFKMEIYLVKASSAELALRSVLIGQDERGCMVTLAKSEICESDFMPEVTQIWSRDE